MMEEINQTPAAVQATNDDSIGYMKDKYLGAFAAKVSRRAPLINRGYYIRCYVIRTILRKFLSQKQKCQVISLGAGFDTSYFLLKEEGLMDGNTFYEVDFPELVKRKTELAKADNRTSKWVQMTEPQGEDEKKLDDNATQQGSVSSKKSPPKSSNKQLHEIHLPDYHLLGVDLRNLTLLTERLKEVGIDFNAPTLLFAECVFMYLLPEDSNAILKWALTQFTTCALLTYEQLIPSDCFGRVMCATLKRRGSPLLGINSYPSCISNKQRFLQLGYQKCTASDMLMLCEKLWKGAEQERVDLVEEFDELEEWLVKCTHYGMILGSYSVDKDCGIFDDLHEILESPQQPYDLLPPLPNDHVPAIVQIRGQFGGRTASTRRWAHAADLINNQVVVFGGFGGEAKQQRLNDVIALNLNTLTWNALQISGITPEPRMFHTLTAISDTALVMVGGRAAPSKPFNDIALLDIASRSWKLCDIQNGPPLRARYRHTASLVKNDHGEYLFVFGGKTATGKKNHFIALDDSYIVTLPDFEYAKITLSGNGPSPRYSHTATPFSFGKKLVVFGGTDGVRRFNDVYILDTSNWSWSNINCSGELPAPRFSHSATIVRSGESEFLLVIGGCSPGSQNDAYLLDLQSFVWQRIRLSLENPSSMMLVKFSLVASGNLLYFVGGGATCFSFGTHINDSLMAEFALTLADIRGGDISMYKQGQTIASASSGPTQKHGIPTTVRRGTVNPVREVINVTKAQWESEIYAERVPVIMRNLDLGPCIKNWADPNYFLQHDASKKISIRVSTEKRLDFVNKNYRFETTTLGDFISKVFDPNTKEKYYFRSVGENMRKDVSDISVSFPEIASDFVIPELFRDIISQEKIYSSALRISSNDIQMWTHYDVMDNILCQIVGSKKVVLWAPEELKHLYIKDSSSLVLNIDEPDLQTFPKFAKANRLEVTLHPGDVLFIPAMWLHNVVTLSPSISVNVFFRHLGPEHYNPKDLYGNKDLIAAEKALGLIDSALAELKQLPRYYHEFYAQMMIEKIKSFVQ